MIFKKPGGSVSWLAVFLGNPGDKYADTRHNAGFFAADEISSASGVKINRLRFKALTAGCDIAGHKVLLMKPQTFMNLSGEAVRQAAHFYKIPPERVLVVADDAALPVGKLRIRKKGSAGGHNGLKSIIACLGTEEFPRIKIGVGGPPHPEYDMADWVLGGFTPAEKKLIKCASENAAAAIQLIIAGETDKAMSRFN
jgi:PTH1 family peptidyl-tRNA hydrolase